MNEIYFYSFFSSVLISLVSFLGIILIFLKEEKTKKYIFIFISLAIGALLGDSFFHLIPESFESLDNTTMVSFLIIGGILLFFILEKVFHFHHHHNNKEDFSTCKQIHPAGKMILFSDGIHNFLDGILIGVSYMAGIEIGIATTIAIVLHEIPQEISDFGILIYSGYTKRKALLFNFISALFAIVGVFVVFLIGTRTENIINILMPISAGGFIYIATSDLIPEMQKNKNWKKSFVQILMIGVGVLLMFLLLKLE